MFTALLTGGPHDGECHRSALPCVKLTLIDGSVYRADGPARPGKKIIRLLYRGGAVPCLELAGGPWDGCRVPDGGPLATIPMKETGEGGGRLWAVYDRRDGRYVYRGVITEAERAEAGKKGKEDGK